jgi:parallel beta-helix repeat protein
MRYGTRATLTAAAITALLAAGVAAALAATPFRPGPSVPVGSVPGDGSQARVGNMSCGETLTESTTLENDLENCAGDGLVAGADGITIDLNGHTIDGQTIPTGTGIVISGVDGVVVKNGTITGFDVGVSIVFGADRTRVRDLRISGSATGNGIEAQALRAAVTGNTVFGRAIGIVVGGTTTTAAGNTVKDNDTGILVGGSRAVVIRNTALSNAGDGIQAVVEATAITGNVANANGEDGIDVAGATGATLDGNSASFNTRLGIDADGDVIDEGGNAATGNGSLHQCENVVCVDAQ